MACGLFGGLFLGVFVQSVRGTTSAASELSLAHDAGVSLQASYNTSMLLKEIPIRIVGVVGCKQTKRFSPTSGSMSCFGRAIGPHSVGGCIQVVGVFYAKLAAFAESAVVREPCPGDGA